MATVKNRSYPGYFTVYYFSLNGIPKYVGITAKKLKYRLVDHKRSANKNSQYLIHKAIRKYGDKLECVPFLCVKTWEEACQVEKFFINQFKTFVKDGGYNLTKGGEGNYGHTKSPELRALISKRQKSLHNPNFTMKNKKQSQEFKDQRRKDWLLNPISRRQIKDNFGNFYKSVTEASKILKIKRTTIHECIKNNRTMKNGLSFTQLELIKRNYE